MNLKEIIVFLMYFIFVLYVGIYFFLKNRRGGEKEYFIGGRQINGYVGALSAGASDMSSWVLMGLPASVFAAGLSQVWIAVGLIVGTVLSWILIAPRLRRFSIVCGDAITIPQYLANRFLSSRKLLQILCAVVFLFAYTIYAASSIKACGILFSTVIGIDITLATYLAAAIIILYTSLGGFSAVCWTDFFQGIIMLLALLVTPIVAVFIMNADSTGFSNIYTEGNFWNLLSSGRLDWGSISSILSGFGWGLGYFGMPHFIVRFMAIKNSDEMRCAQKLGTTWTTLILTFAVVTGIVGRQMFFENLSDSSLVFITMVRRISNGIISGLLLSAILAAAMSSADSQLLTASSAFGSDIYRHLVRRNISDKEMLWIGRIVVILTSAVALVIAVNPNSGSIMSLVENAWGLFGAAFSPVVLLSLYYKKMTYYGAVAGIFAGAVTDILWKLFLFNSTKLYEIIPGFLIGFIVVVVVSKFTKKSSKIEQLFDESVSYAN